MKFPRKWMWVGLSLAALCTLSLAETQAETKAETRRVHSKHSKKPTTPQLVLPPLAGGPLQQLPMDQMPSAPPKVGYQSGLLTIVAQNSTLGDILRDVHNLTGANIDIPGNANERVVTRLGPGAPRDVLASLLNGSSFNYVMLGSNSDPSAVTSVVLTAKSAGGGQTQAAANPYQPVQGYPAPVMPNPQVVVPQPVNNQPQDAAQGDENANGDEPDANAEENADSDQTDPNGTAPVPEQQAQPAPPQAGGPGPKTPEQILEMLRRQQPSGTNPNTQQPPEN